jgi:hypothetical protein
MQGARVPARRTPAASPASYGGTTMSGRPCSKVACNHDATSTLTYVYADSMAVLGPLSYSAEPHSYDLCERHAERLSAPQGWQVVRHVFLGA